MTSFYEDVLDSNLRLELQTASALAEMVDSPRSLAVHLLLQNAEYGQLIEMETDPTLYSCPQKFADDYMITDLLSKSVNLPLGIDREAKAKESFYDSERLCKLTNDRLSRVPKEWSSRIHSLELRIKSMLPPIRKRDLLFIEEGFRFGPGATTGAGGHGSTLSEKYNKELHLTQGLIPFYRPILGERWWNTVRKPEVVKGNRFTVVPKNAKTDRGICIEPSLNIYVQLGIGKIIRRNLKRFSIDLNTQTVNQKCAERAYRDNLATIDLSKASDTVSYGCVELLIPPDWLTLLNLARSSFTNIDGNDIPLEKFSSMGNGFTFELESLIFAAIAFDCVPEAEHGDVSVFGDDIIVPQAYTSSVIETLEFLGFKVNAKKSFLAGSFFESCGTDYHFGVPVRPFYLRQDPGSKIPYRIQIANNIRRYANMRSGGTSCCARFRPIWLSIFQKEKKDVRRCLVPASLGDVGFIVSHKEAKPQRLQHGLEGFMVKTVQSSATRRKSNSFGFLLSRLASFDPTGLPTYGREPIRGYLGRLKTKLIPVSHWDGGFEWDDV